MTIIISFYSFYIILSFSQTVGANAGGEWAHLAGAAGLPVWILTPRGRSLMWYWFSSGNRSPWYKNAMIFRLKAGYKWRDLMSEISKMVTKLDLNDGFSL